LPRELRDQVYHLAFSPDYDALPDYPDDDAPIPHSAAVAAPRLTCRRMSEEATTIAFQENIHVLNLFQCRRSNARPGHVLNRMFNIEYNLVKAIRRIALYADVDDVDELLDELQSQYWHIWSPAQRLRELRIILDAPYIDSTNWRRARIRAENQVCHAVSQLSNVELAVVQNIFYRDGTDFRSDTERWRWRTLMWEDDDDRLSDDR
jgi:hypothetical protein